MTNMDSCVGAGKKRLAATENERSFATTQHAIMCNVELILLKLLARAHARDQLKYLLIHLFCMVIVV